MTSTPDGAGNEHVMGSDDRDIGRLIDRLKWAEHGVESARGDFVRLRNTVDSAGELALWERLESAERALQDAIGELDEIVYPVGQASGGG